MEIENSNIDNLKQPKETDNALIKRYEELGGINFQTEDDNRKKVLERTKNQLTIYLNLCKQGKSLIRNLEKKKDFHNPDQLNDLIKSFGLSQYGSNFPEEIFDPNESEKSLKKYNDEKNLRKPPSILTKGNANLKGSSSYTPNYSQAQHIKQSLWDSHQKRGASHSFLNR